MFVASHSEILQYCELHITCRSCIWMKNDSLWPSLKTCWGLKKMIKLEELFYSFFDENKKNIKFRSRRIRLSSMFVMDFTKESRHSTCHVPTARSLIGRRNVSSSPKIRCFNSTQIVLLPDRRTTSDGTSNRVCTLTYYWNWAPLPGKSSAVWTQLNGDCLKSLDFPGFYLVL